MYFSKQTKKFSIPVTWNIFCILPCSVNLVFTTLLKKRDECIFLTFLCCQYLYESCWFSWDILSLTKSVPESFKFVGSSDLLSRLLRLYISNCFCFNHVHFTITLANFFVRWQAYKISGTTLNPVSKRVLQTLYFLYFSKQRASLLLQ